ncbi:MAG: hypothetical protein N2444_04600 [Methylocystis sp.]|nr:hypothetical protein [Methylocystis sp.]
MRDSRTAARSLKAAGSIFSARALLVFHALLACAVAAVIWLGAAGPAEAHGRLGAAAGRCRLYIGPDIMNFTGYLPEASKSEFCEDIPDTGPMIMVLDAEQEELRDMAVEIRIVKDVGGEEKENENLEAVTVAHSPPKVYRTGTVNFEHNFPESGYFVGIVTVTGDHGERWVSRFPFSVGMTFMRELPMYVALALGVIAAFLAYLAHRKLQPTPQMVAAAAAFKPPPFKFEGSAGRRDENAPRPDEEGPPPVEAKSPDDGSAAASTEGDDVADNSNNRDAAE